MESWKTVAKIHVALVCVQIIFSGNQIASKIGMRYFHPSIFLLTRCAIVSPIMFLLAKIKEKEVLPKSRRELFLLIGMAFCSFLSFETFIFGMQITSVATGTTLQATSPLWTLLIALALKLEGPSFMKIAGVICAILGAVISVAGNQVFLKLSGDGSASSSQNKDFPGGLLLVANAICYSGFVTLQKYVLRTVKPLTCTAWNITICAIFVFFVAIFFVDTVDLEAVTLEGWLSVVYVSLLAMATAYALLSWAANQTSTTVIAVYSTVMPVLSPIMSFFILSESVSIIQIVGMCVTVGGVFLVIRARHVEEKKRKLLELSSSTTTNDDVTIVTDTDKLLLGQKGIEMDEMDNRVSITFGVDEANNEWSIEDSDDENEKEGRKKKGGYAIVSTNINNDSAELNTGLREVVASA